MSKTFNECADDMSQRSKNLNFFDTLIGRLQKESKKKFEDPYDMKQKDSETAYFHGSNSKRLVESKENNQSISRRNIYPVRSVK